MVVIARDNPLRLVGADTILIDHVPGEVCGDLGCGHAHVFFVVLGDGTIEEAVDVDLVIVPFYLYRTQMAGNGSL